MEDVLDLALRILRLIVLRGFSVDADVVGAIQDFRTAMIITGLS